MFDQFNPAVVGCTMLLAIVISSNSQAEVKLESPDKSISVTFDVVSSDGQTSVPKYHIERNGKSLVKPSALGLDLVPAGPFGPVNVQNVERLTSDTNYKVFPGKSSEARDHYNQAAISLKEAGDSGRRYDVIFRAYDDGVAFSYNVPKQDGLSDFTVAEEDTEFFINGNPESYILPVEIFDTPYEKDYLVTKLHDAPNGELIGFPLLMQYPDKSCIAITEAHLHDYAGLYVTPTTGTAGLLRGRLAPLEGQSDVIGAKSLKVKSTLPHDTPWRVVMIGDNPGRLIESNIVNNLNPPSVITDTSWIKPGKTTFPWWNGFACGPDLGFKCDLNTATMKHYIDFCAESGFEYHSLDGAHGEAWYGGKTAKYSSDQDILTALPEIDLPEVIRYAKEKKVGLRLWMNWQAARKQMYEAFPLYEKWGIEGVMLDFFNRDDQEVVNYVEEMAALAAKHHLTVTVHNFYKPTGLNRTYPNVMTYEAVKNLEYDKWQLGSTPEHELIVPFARMIAGPLDYHSGGFRYSSKADFKPHNVAPIIIGTRARELARYVVYEGYLPMAADYPAAYRGQPGLKELVDMPTYWDETREIQGEIGDYITIARRKGTTWYVGTMTDNEARDLTIPLNFLGDGNYKASIYSDDAKEGAKREDLKTDSREVTSKDSIKTHLISAGGNFVILKQQ